MKKRVDEAAIPVHNGMSRQTHVWGANGKAANSGGSQGGRKGAQKSPRGSGAGSGSPRMG